MHVLEVPTRKIVPSLVNHFGSTIIWSYGILPFYALREMRSSEQAHVLIKHTWNQHISSRRIRVSRAY